MIKESEAMREIHKIREKMYEESKGLSDKEHVEKIRREAKECVEKYGLKIETVKRIR